MQFRVEDDPVANVPIVEKENIEEPSSPIVSTENEFLITEGVVAIMEEERVETNVGSPPLLFKENHHLLKEKGRN